MARSWKTRDSWRTRSPIESGTSEWIGLYGLRHDKAMSCRAQLTAAGESEGKSKRAEMFGQGWADGDSESTKEDHRTRGAGAGSRRREMFHHFWRLSRLLSRGFEARKAQVTGLAVNQVLEDLTRRPETAENWQPSARPGSSRCWDVAVRGAVQGVRSMGQPGGAGRPGPDRRRRQPHHRARQGSARGPSRQAGRPEAWLAWPADPVLPRSWGC